MQLDTRRTATGTLTRRRHLPLAALLGANAVSLVGSRITYLAIPWFVLVTTGSAAKTGLVAFTEALAAAGIGVVGGPLVDRVGHKRASVAADLASGATVAMIPLLHATAGLAFWQLLALVFVRSLCDAPGGTARDALAPDVATLAGTPMERANVSIQVVERGARLIGSPLAGVLIVALGASDALWLDAATFAASALIVAVAVPGTASGPARESYLDQIASGLRFIRRDRLLLAIAATVAITNCLENPLFAVVLPVYVKQTLGSAVDLGLLLAGVGAGAVIGAVVFGALGRWLPRRAPFVGAFVVLGLPYWVLALMPSLGVGVAAMLVAGIAAGPINPLIDTVKQERVPAALRGRVFGAMGAIALAATPLGLALSGFLLDWTGLRVTLLVIAAGFLVTTLSMVVNPAFRDLNLRPGCGDLDCGLSGRRTRRPHEGDVFKVSAVESLTARRAQRAAMAANAARRWATVWLIASRMAGARCKRSAKSARERL